MVCFLQLLLVVLLAFMGWQMARSPPGSWFSKMLHKTAIRSTHRFTMDRTFTTLNEATPPTSAADLTDQLEYSPRACQPITAINFVRIPKTGSTTMLNVLYRFMLSHGLDPVLLTTEYIQPPRSYLYDSEFIVPKQNHSIQFGNYSLFGEHIIYNKTESRRLLRPGFVNFVSVRQPVPQLRAMFKEWPLAKWLHLKQPDTDPAITYLEDLANGLHRDRRNLDYFLRGNMAHLLGLPCEKITDLSAISDLLKDLDEEFGLMLVQEYFDESLVLLRRRLCWEVRDIIYTATRVRKALHITRPLSWTVERFHRMLYPAEYLLYDHVVNRLMRQISQEPLFWTELRRFKEILKRVSAFCDSVYDRLCHNVTSAYDIAEDPKTLYVDASPFGSPFSVSGIDCMMYNLYTISFRWLLAARKYPNICDDFPHMRTYSACTEMHAKHNLPIKMFTRRVAHMKLWGNENTCPAVRLN